MAVESVIVGRVNGYGSIAADTAGEVAPGLNYEGEQYPRIRYEMTSTEFVPAITTGETTSRRSEFGFLVLGRSYSEAVALAGQVELALHGFQTLSAGLAVDRVILTDYATSVEPPDDGSRDPIHRVDLTFSIYWRNE